MRRHRNLIASPLKWQTKAAPVPHPAVPVLAERGGTQLKTPRPVILVDTREQNPFDFSRFEGWFAGIEKRALKLGDYSVAGLEEHWSWNARISRILSTPSLRSGPCSSIG
jgi:hypothetical protein